MAGGRLRAAASSTEAAGSHPPVAWLSLLGGRLRPCGPGALMGDGAVGHVVAGPRRGVGGQEGDRSCRLPSSCPVWVLNSWRTRPSTLESSRMPGWSRLWCLRWGSAGSRLGNRSARSLRTFLQQVVVVPLSPDRFPTRRQHRGFQPCPARPGVTVSSSFPVTHLDPVHFNAKAYGWAGPVFRPPGSLALYSFAGIPWRNSIYLYPSLYITYVYECMF